MAIPPEVRLSFELAGLHLHEESETVPQNDFNSFTPFPKLPVELRLAIWKLALPNGQDEDRNRVFLVRAYNNPTRIAGANTPQSRILVSTGSPNPYLYWDQPEKDRAARELKMQRYRSDMLDLSFLATCHESRNVFIERFNTTLPACNNGLMRFDDQTTIWFENLLSQDFLPSLEAKYEGANPAESYRLPEWFSTIRRLCITSPRGDMMLQRWRDIWKLLLNFTALESCKLEVSTFTMAGSWIDWRDVKRDRLANTARLIAEINEWAEGHPKYNVPAIGEFQWA
jgi:hypothetical protein